MSRSCARPGCSRPAVATLSYDYAAGVAELEELSAEAHPMVHDLCRPHASSVRVPRGWQLVDTWSAGERDRELVEGVPAQLDLIGA